MPGYILVVDDDPETRSALSAGLEFRGFYVATASNGLEALRIVQQDRPTLVLLDIEMPVLDGWGFAKQAAELSIEVPIIAMSGRPDALAIAREIGAIACLTKPLDVARLFASIEAVVNSLS